jgi:hypothetical protein
MEEAEKRAKALVKHLNNLTGVKWSPKWWSNMGFHHSAEFGTLSVSQGSYNYNLDSFHIMNRGNSDWIGTGHPEVGSKNFRGQENLLDNIKLSIIQMIEVRDKWNDAISLNDGIF